LIASTATTARARLVIARTWRSAATASPSAMTVFISRASAASIMARWFVFRRMAQSSAHPAPASGLT
jgi:hypothetical protein